VVGTLVHGIDTQGYWRIACEQGAVPLERLSPDDFPDIRSLREYWRAEAERLVRFVRSRRES
jgi:hypothetical protein